MQITRWLGAVLMMAPIVMGSAHLARADTSGLLSYRPPDGLILSTGNLYFTSHAADTASVWREAQSAVPGQEILLYSEPDARFGDLVYAQVGGVYWGYFFDTNGGVTTIKRVPLTGGAATTLATVTGVDVVNSHRNLVTDGTYLYWQDATAVRKMPIGGGASTVLATTQPSTPTAGIVLRNNDIIYATGTYIRYVPVSGLYRGLLHSGIITITATPVTALYAVSKGIYWGEQSGAVRVKVGTTTTTLPSATGLVPTSIGTNGYTTGAAQVWTQCGAQACQMEFDFPVGSWSTTIGANAIGAAVTSSGAVFWGDANGVHRQTF